MKHFLKPFGHCLTTAVMTSTMLRIYALPAEAAPPNPIPPSTEDSSPPPTEVPSVPAPTPIAVQAVVPPETIHPLESSPRPAAPAVASPPDNPASATPVIKAGGQEKPIHTTNGKTPVPSVPPHSKPAALEAPVAEPPAMESEANMTLSSTPTEKEAPEAVPQKPNSSANAQTIAGMRQTLEKRLATIVERDKATRNAQWQQNLMYTALQYAWLGQFKQARQIAAHPALPVELQTELLTKIAAVETQLSLPIAQNQPSAIDPRSGKPRANQSAGQPNSSQTTATGRAIPPSYSVADASSPWSGYAGFSLSNQCPPLDQLSAPVSSGQVQPAGAKARRTSAHGIPAFVPALGQNLATRLVQLNRASVGHAVSTANARQSVAKQLIAKQAVAQPNAKQSIVVPHLFAGGTTSSLPDQSKPKAQPSTALVQTGQPSLQANSHPVATLLPQQLDPSSEAKPTVGHLNLESAESTLNYSFKQISTPLHQFISNPLDLAWNWWTVPGVSQVADAPLQQVGWDVARAEEFSMQPLTEPIVAEAGLGNISLLQTLEQELTSAFKPARDARKLSIPTIPTLAKSPSSASKVAPYDAATLMAMSCARAQLSHYKADSYVVDPATSKRMGWVNLMYPLPIPAVITSAFGWRMHPISGNLSFHSGLDIGAPMGTPVLSALPGRVVAADSIGGYGLAVVVENETTRQRNLYGHLSGIAVQPGVQVTQGTVLGWVGSTGNSTGPHLHFESQVHTDNGWTAVDPLATAALSIAQGRNP